MSKLHPKGRSHCFVFDQQLGGCEVLKASKPKRPENAFIMYVSCHSDHLKGSQCLEERLQIKDFLDYPPNIYEYFLFIH